ncbi:alpha/beta hydrolase family protein [Sphingomonas sp. DT-207]|uniref:alpha/beta hydrolase family protein n=1 Tax=Sphingomonas sp. DT-207 TaxID=3396167 RepID=UPI003F5412B1
MRFPWLAVLCLLPAPAAIARPYTIEDMLRLESYGQVLVDPAGRVAIVERRDRYDSAPRYSYDWMVRRSLSKLLVVDLAAPKGAEPLFAQAKAAGYWASAFSPSGSRLSIFRLQGDRLQLGVVDLASRKVRWLDLVPDLPAARPAPVWIDEDRLLVVTLDDGGLPGLFQTPTNAQRDSIRRWEGAASGRRASSDLLGSGRYLGRGSSYRARRIVEVDLASGATHMRMQGDVLDMALSGDRTKLAVLTKGPPVQPDPGASVDPAFEPRRQRLTILDLVTGARQEPCGCDVLPSLLHWAPAGAHLLFYGRRDGSPWSAGTLYLSQGSPASTTTPLPGDVRPVTRIGGGSARFVRAGWAGERAFVLAERAGDQRRVWYVFGPRGEARPATALRGTTPTDLVAAGTSHFAFADTQGLWRASWSGALHKIASGPVTRIRPTLFDGHSLGTRAWLNAVPERGLAAVGTGDGQRAYAEDRAGRFRAHSVRQDDQILATTPTGALILYREDAQGVGTLAKVDGDEWTTLDRINRHLAEVTPAKRVLLHSRAADGTLLNHWLLLPSKAGGAPPRLVVVPYPGYPYGPTPPADSAPATPTTMTHPLLLVGAGYAVLQPSIPLGDGPGEPLADIAAVLDKAIDAAQASGRVSRAPPFLVGHSYGGYTALGVAAVSPRFGAVVAANGIYDLASAYAAMDPRLNYAESGISLTIPIGWSEGGQGRMGVPPWKDIARYTRNSAFYRVEDIRAPVLLIHSDLDYVPQAQAERMFLALYRTGKDAMLLRYRGESHSLTSPANLRDYWAHVLSFLAEAQSAGSSRPQ